MPRAVIVAARVRVGTDAKGECEAVSVVATISAVAAAVIEAATGTDISAESECVVAVVDIINYTNNRAGQMNNRDEAVPVVGLVVAAAVVVVVLLRMQYI